jgi:hypothetical protein
VPITSDAEEIGEGKGEKHTRRKNEKKRLEDLFIHINVLLRK